MGEDLEYVDQKLEELMDLPPSAKLVYKVLDEEGEQTLNEIAEESLLGKDTARYAINRLDNIDAIYEQQSLKSAERLYSLPEEYRDL